MEIVQLKKVFSGEIQALKTELAALRWSNTLAACPLLVILKSPSLLVVLLVVGVMLAQSQKYQRAISM